MSQEGALVPHRAAVLCFSQSTVLLTVHGRRLQHPAEDTLFHVAPSSETLSLQLACSPNREGAHQQLTVLQRSSASSLLFSGVQGNGPDG